MCFTYLAVAWERVFWAHAWGCTGCLLHAELRVGHAACGGARAAIRSGFEAAALGYRVARQTGFQGEELQGSISPFLCFCIVLVPLTSYLGPWRYFRNNLP